MLPEGTGKTQNVAQRAMELPSTHRAPAPVAVGVKYNFWWQQTMLRIKDPKVTVPFYEKNFGMKCVGESAISAVPWHRQPATVANRLPRPLACFFVCVTPQ